MPPVSALSVLSKRLAHRVVEKFTNVPTQKLIAVINNACKRANMTRARNF